MRLVPHSLGRQFRLAFTILLALVGAFIGASVWELERARRGMSELSETQLKTLRATTRLAALTETVSTGSAQILLATDAGSLTERSDALQSRLNDIETLLPELTGGETDDLILDFQQLSQAYRTAVNAVVQLSAATLRDEQEFHAALARRLGEVSDSPGQLVSLVRLSMDEPGAALTGELGELRQRQLTRRGTLRRFAAELRSLGGEMADLTQNAAHIAGERYDSAMKANLAASRDSLTRLLVLLMCGLLAGFLVVRQLVNRRILRRIDAVSARLRGETDGVVPAEIALRGRDEIADMARAVEEFLEDRRKLEETRVKLEVARIEADRANRMKSEFLANMSHEIRTPMNAILGYAQLMARDEELPASQRDRVNTINRAGEHLLSLINDILEMSKIEAGSITLNESSFDLRVLLKDIVELHSARADAKGLSLRLIAHDDLPRHIRSDEGKLRQSLNNLIGNAVKFTAKGGVTITESHTLAPDGAIAFTFTVSDTGPGIAPEEIGRLFRPFVQSAAGASVGGTGLGLAISRSYAKLLGGDLTVESAPGEGSRFHLTLIARTAPAKAETKRVTTAKVKRLAPGQPPVRVLVADDVELNCRLLLAILTPMGFEVRTAVDGVDALKVFKEWRPRVVLMDMRMPVMDGYEASRLIKNTPEGRETFVLAITASAFEEDKAAVLASGADAFMRKPFVRDELLALLGEHLGIRYEYADTSVRGEAAKPAADGTTKTDFSKLPPETVAAFRKACEEADYEHLLQLCETLKKTDSGVSESLRERVAVFDYEGLVKMLPE